MQQNSKQHNAQAIETTIRKQSPNRTLQEVVNETNEKGLLEFKDTKNDTTLKIEALIGQYKENSKASKYVVGEIKRFLNGLNIVDNDIICCIGTSLKTYSSKVIMFE